MFLNFVTFRWVLKLIIKCRTSKLSLFRVELEEEDSGDEEYDENDENPT